MNVEELKSFVDFSADRVEHITEGFIPTDCFNVKHTVLSNLNQANLVDNILPQETQTKLHKLIQKLYL